MSAAPEQGGLDVGAKCAASSIQQGENLVRTYRRYLPVFAVALAILAAPGLFQGCSGCTCEECFGAGVADGDELVRFIRSRPNAPSPPRHAPPGKRRRQ